MERLYISRPFFQFERLYPSSSDPTYHKLSTKIVCLHQYKILFLLIITFFLFTFPICMETYMFVNLNNT